MKTFKLVDEDNNEYTYEILLAFWSNKFKKNYLVYTDNTYEDDALNIYASIFDPEDDTVFIDVETDEEWEEINNKINDNKIKLENIEEKGL